MNTDTFRSLQELMNNMECDDYSKPNLVKQIKTQCEQVLHLIKDLQYSDNSAHVQLATKQALQYIQRALLEAETYVGGGRTLSVNAKGNLRDICGPAHASLEIILSLNKN